MKQILIIGAGRSSTLLINYLKNYVLHHDLELVVADADVKLAAEKVGNEAYGARVRAVGLDIFDNEQRNDFISQADIVISMIPASFHLLIAESCIQFKKHMLSASYVADEIKALEPKAKEAGILLLKECGLDPGIDHMTAMQAINEIKEKGGKLLSFRSFTGGLIAPESDNNPWNYKFTWNPRNVVLAGQGAAKYIRNGNYKYIPYHQLFKRIDHIEVEGLGGFDGYANRDSLKYREIYNLKDIPTLLRGTLRRTGYCSAWNVFVQLGLTDDSYYMEGIEHMSWREYMNAFLAYDAELSVEDKLCKYVGISKDSDEFKRIAWLGLFADEPVGLEKATPAQVLQHKLEQKWVLEPDDKDMIVMQHIFDYELQGQRKRLYSTMVSFGDDQQKTAMAKTVGWPLAIAAKLVLEGKIKATGIHIPIDKSIYEPILEELADLGVSLIHKEEDLEVAVQNIK